MTADCKSLAPTWEDLAHDFAGEESILIAKVDAEADSSKQTAKDQGVTSYPTIKFFPKGNKTPEDYQGGRSIGDLLNFLNEKAGTYRIAGGGLNDAAGTIEALDKIVAKYTGGTSISDALKEAKKEAESVKAKANAKYAEYYVKVFDKLAKSEAYASKEYARLEGILSKGGLAATKSDELTSKINILRRFVEKATGEAESKDTKDEL